MPRVAKMPPSIRIGHLVTPSPYTEYGVKGAGEGGRMVAPPALAAAIEDALRPLGVRIDTAAGDAGAAAGADPRGGGAAGRRPLTASSRNRTSLGHGSGSKQLASWLAAAAYRHDILDD